MLKDLMYVNEEREDGFSLVELLVVIVIVGILSSIAVGAFMNQRKKANDASLKADLRTAANQIITWSIDNDMDDFRAATATGAGSSMLVEGEGAVHSLPNTPKWNDVEGFPDIQVSKGNTVEIIMKKNADASWDTAFEEGEFCLTASSPHSSYDYLPGSGQGHRYDKYLYWDAKMGGVRDMDTLVKARTNGTDMSCYSYVDTFTRA